MFTANRIILKLQKKWSHTVCENITKICFNFILLRIQSLKKASRSKRPKWSKVFPPRHKKYGCSFLCGPNCYKTGWQYTHTPVVRVLACSSPYAMNETLLSLRFFLFFYLQASHNVKCHVINHEQLDTTGVCRWSSCM